MTTRNEMRKMLTKYINPYECIATDTAYYIESSDVWSPTEAHARPK